MAGNRAFRPGSIDYDGAMSRNYGRGRALRPEVAELWHQVLDPYFSPLRSRRVLDLGSGTGRFSSLLAQWFGVRVVGIEPSRGMRAAADSFSGVSCAAGTAEAIPLSADCVDLVWISQVWHHIRDRGACARELRRVLRPHGLVVFRGNFADRLGDCTVYRYFPKARAIVEESFPTLHETVETFASAGFEYETLRTVVQPTCVDLAELAQRTRLRADTTLALLTDDEFNQGQSGLERAAAESPSDPVIDTVDLAVFRLNS
ncbi:MAG: class I SAM-dependent methyltransferase [Candidatus Binataceae bacterium]